jgi:hypothetical protein
MRSDPFNVNKETLLVISKVDTINTNVDSTSASTSSLYI